MKTTYRGCDISINLLAHESDLIGYKYYIATHEGGQTLDHEFEETMSYISNKKTINRLVSKAQKWIDNFLGD